MQYLIDTSILITAHKISNPIDIHPTFWKKLKEIFSREDVISLDKVKNEIFYYEDLLTEWCKANIKESFWKSSESCLEQYAEIQNWAHTRNYNITALADFANSKNADPYLVSFALNKARNENEKIAIVTLEVNAPESKKSIKLPDVCDEFNIISMDNNTFYRSIKTIF